MKKKLILIISALLLVAFSFGAFAGCDLVTPNNERDMAQVVAEVNVAENTDDLDAAFAALGDGNALSEDVKNNLTALVSTDEIYKRDLVTYFLSYGSNYVNSGYTYGQTFELLITALADRKIISQFATLYYLSVGTLYVDSDYIDGFEMSATNAGYVQDDTGDGYHMDKELSVTDYLSAIEGKEGDEAAIAGYSYFLTDAEITYAHYLVQSSINSAIDSYEQTLINDDSTDETSDDRTTPTGMNTLADYYYPMQGEDVSSLDYGVYTGLNEAENCGAYETIDGSTRSTRRTAYARFISSLRANNLIEDGEALDDPTLLSYYDVELKTQLEQLVITKFMSTVSLTMSNEIEDRLLTDAYDELVASQQVSSASGFTTTMDSVSDTSFIVYSPENKTYGFVYNILLPFNTNQEYALSELQAQYGTDSAEYYTARAALYKHITATDQRESWFNGAEDYSFKAADAGYTEYYGYQEGEDAYLFFEDSLTKSESGIARYAGLYPYNGTVEYNETDKTYKLTPNELDIDAFIAEFEGYIDFVVNGGNSGASVTSTIKEASASFYTPSVSADDIKDKNYEFAIYYEGKVDLGSGSNSANYLVKDNVSYKALSAVNELMFAYTTDTAGLNTYFGYSVETKEENSGYVAEFEYAAQKLILNESSDYGRGAYCVVATDYGWHIIYVTFTYDGGLVYEDGFVYGDRNTEGTFSYYFYQSMKSSVTSSYTSEKQNELLTALEENCVTYYEDRYSDLTSIGA